MNLLIAVFLTSAILGYGVYLVITALVTPEAPLQAELERLSRSEYRPGAAVSLAERLGRIGGQVSSTDLEVLGWTPLQWYRRRVLFAAGGVVAGAVIALFLRLFAVFPLLLAVPVLGLLVGAIAVFVADSDRSTRAEEQRSQIRLALCHFLEITSISLAGGAGAETALEEAVVRGRGPGFRLFAREIARAKEDPTMSAFTALRDLGQRIGIRDLVEFGNVMILSSESAATVRRALDDKATLIILREHERRKAAALSRNVIMSIPVVGMAGGFILWLMYPALAGLANI